jgi:hypothetical protein
MKGKLFVTLLPLDIDEFPLRIAEAVEKIGKCMLGRL